MVKIVPVGFSNTLIYTDDRIGLQFRVPEKDADDVEKSIHYPYHFSLWGGKHEGNYDPLEEAVRELHEEVTGTKDISNALRSEGVYLMPLPEQPDGTGPVVHNCDAFLAQGFTHWVNWMYSIQVPQTAQSKEGQLRWFQREGFHEDRLPGPMMSAYGPVVRHVMFDQPTNLVHALTTDMFLDTLIAQGYQVPDVFDKYRGQPRPGETGVA